MSIAPTHHPQSWQGSLRLSFGRQGSQTRLMEAFSQAPLKVQRPFASQDGRCKTMLLHTAGGLVGGDRLDYHITLHPGSQVQLTTASAGKIYPNQGSPTLQQVDLQLSAGSYLEWIPRETILFEGANHHQSLRVELEPGAVWLGCDLIRWGRTARGEHFGSGSWRSETEVWQQGKPLWIDRQRMVGGSAVLSSPNGLAGYAVMGTWTLIGQALDSDRLRQLRQLGYTLLDPAREQWGLTQLSCGILGRYRGHSTQRAWAWMMALGSQSQRSGGEGGGNS
ncbi:MAG: urease accessory protein UreD [Synechococcaceae cyanobacterium SM2_3_2]|nr:urease accessory protein UreD [Synechococcaceae cyanobacterium SM2_3_2]